MVASMLVQPVLVRDPAAYLVAWPGGWERGPTRQLLTRARTRGHGSRPSLPAWSLLAAGAPVVPHCGP